MTHTQSEPPFNWRATQILNCNEKRRYITQSACDDTIHSMSQDGALKKKPTLRSYACSICKGWHMTSSEDRR